MSAATLKPMRLEFYLPRLPGAKRSHDITWHDDMRVCRLTWREDSVSPALIFYRGRVVMQNILVSPAFTAF